jgi:hypothetical protein
MQRSSVFASALSVLLAALGLGRVEATVYTYTPLDDLSAAPSSWDYSGTFPTCISSGTIYGYWADYYGQSHGFSYSVANHVYSPLDDPNANSMGTTVTGASGGTVIGNFTDSNGVAHGFSEINGTYTTLDDPNAAPQGGTYVTGISGGTIVGYYMDSHANNHGFSYNMNSNVFTTLSNPTAQTTSLQAGGISGTTIVGIYTDGTTYGSGNSDYGFSETGGVYTILDPAIATHDLEVYGISGTTIVGSFADSSWHGFSETGGIYTILDDPASTLHSTVASGADGGTIVGYYFDHAGGHGFIATPAVAINWASASSGNWDTAGSWDLQATPDSTLNVLITPSAGLTVSGPASPTTVNSLTLGCTSGTVQLSLQAGGTLMVIGSLSITSGGTINLPAGGKLIVQTAATDHALIQVPIGGLTVVAGSQIDLTNHDALLRGAAANEAPFNSVFGAPQLAPQGVGGTQVYVTTGVLTGVEWNSVHGSSLFDGQSVSPTDLLLQYALAGDTTLKGYITASDFAQLDASYLLGTPNPSWFQGDFNHDGKIDYQDYALIDCNFAMQSGVLASAEIAADSARFGSAFTSYYASLTAPVPEPASLGLLLALGALSCQARRHRC